MKTLAPDEMDCLLGIRTSDLHPLEILGYAFTNEGTRIFREERPDFLPQIFSYIQGTLRKTSVFPKDVDPCNPESTTFIFDNGSSFIISGMEETSLNRVERISTSFFSEAGAIHQYIRRVANPDYL